MKRLKGIQLTKCVWIIATLALLASCKSKQVTQTTAALLEQTTRNQLVSEAITRETKYKTISTKKGSIEFKIGDSSQKAPAVFKIVKDETLQVSVRIPIIGAEAMRMTLTPDSVVIIDRLKKRYAAEGMNAVSQYVDFNFYNLQALLTNQLFVPGTKNISTNDYPHFSLSSTSDVHLLQTKDKNNMLYSFAIDASHHLASTLIYAEVNDFTIQWSYTDFIQRASYTYPSSIAAKINVGKKHFDVEIAYEELEIDTPMTIDKSIPSKYTKISLTDLIDSYIKIK